MGALMQIKDALSPSPSLHRAAAVGSSPGPLVLPADQAGLGRETLVAARNQFLSLAAGSKTLADTAKRPRGRAAIAHRVDPGKNSGPRPLASGINATLATAWGSTSTSTTSSIADA